MSITFATEVTLSESGFLFDHSTGFAYTLNPTGQFIFRHLKDGIEAKEILSALLEEFEVGEPVARKDLDDFYRQLKEAGIIE